MTGVKLSVKSDPVYPQWGLCEPIIGRVCKILLLKGIKFKSRI